MEDAAAALDQINFWDAGSPGYRWNEIAMSQGLRRVGKIGPHGNYRMMTLLNVAVSGYAEIREAGDRVFGPGEVVTFQPESIHSVVNETDRVTVSLHVYGKHVNYTIRSQFDLAKKIETPFILKVD